MMTGGSDDPGDRISWKVVSAVAEAEGIDPTTVEPSLQSVIDIDALEALFHGGGAIDGVVTFEFSGFEISVYSDGAVEVDETA